jgi:hypothetical protein
VGSYSCGTIAQLQLLPLLQTIQHRFIGCLQWRYGSQIMCCTDGCKCGIPAKTINDIAKELAELSPPIELENQQPSNTQTETGDVK